MGIRQSIPNAASAIVAIEKVRDYLLNPDHPDGGSKAVWFESLGYTRANSAALMDDLLSIAHSSDWFEFEPTEFGVKYRAVGRIAATGHRQGRVVTV